LELRTLTLATCSPVLLENISSLRFVNGILSDSRILLIMNQVTDAIPKLSSTAFAAISVLFYHATRMNNYVLITRSVAHSVTPLGDQFLV